MIWNKSYECMERDQLEKLQLERLQSVTQLVYQNVPFYRERMQELGVEPADIKSLADIRLLPFTNKTDLRDTYPFGLFAAPMEDIVRIHASSGTTGKPTVVGYTQHDLNVWAECTARSIACAGGTKGSVVQVAYGYGLFTGGLGLHYGAERIGATVIPISGGNTKRQLMLMEDFGTTILCCTPSYALMMGETLHEMGISLNRLKLKSGVFGAEPWTEGMRARIEELLGISALNIYGLSETMGPGVAMECMEGRHGMHVWEDNCLIEIVNPDTGEPLPDGEVGELVITTINRNGFPTIRYRTHDLTSIIPEPCVCGRTHKRINRFKGRTDDMLIIRGVNVFPSQIETVLMSIEGVVPHYLLVVDRVDSLDTLEVQVEMAPEMFSDEVRKIEALNSKLKHAIEQALGLTVVVKLVEPKGIERSEGKAKRIIDNRKLYE